MYRKKLIEVALPLEEINYHAAREKSIRHGHPSTLHLWWARRPLAACRAVLFASLVDDPSAHPEKFPTEEAQKKERDRLFGILKRLVPWEASNDPEVLAEARREILASTGGNPPPVLDPFCGGGSIPLEAQRLGLKAYASDLNPVAVLITKALVEIPPKFADKPPINPKARSCIGGDRNWRGAAGLAEDVRYYGQWMRDRAFERIGHLYPKVKLPKEQGGGEATVIAWLWARTVKCPNPACGAQMPLVRSFVLSSKRNIYVEPLIDRAAKRVEFRVRQGGRVPEPPKVARGAQFKCLVCGAIAQDSHIKAEGSAGRIRAQLMAIVAEGPHGRAYVPPVLEHEALARSARPSWAPEEPLPYEPRAIWCTLYGLTRHRDLFTPRQLVALVTFSDLVGEARAKLLGDGACEDYANAVATYLAFAVDKCADYWSTIATWMPRETVGHAFSKQAIPMTWDFPEANPFGDFHCSWEEATNWIAKVIVNSPLVRSEVATGRCDAASFPETPERAIVLTDPPYYDNVGYADLSDVFYVWLRRSIKDLYPELFNTVLTPKAEELVANPYRFDGDAKEAARFFEHGLRKTFARLRKVQHPEYPLALYYAFKQSETEEEEEINGNHGESVVSTGWETMLQGLVDTGLQVTATWPVRTERKARSIAIGTNALASSIVIACRPRPEGAPKTTRAEFLRALRKELPRALRELRASYIAPVDLAQAAIGPGMAVFSRYAAVLEADGSPMPVRTALALINQVLDEVLAEEEAEYDAETRWAVVWFEQHGFSDGPFGDAETLAKAKNVAVGGLEEAGIVEARGGKVHLLKRGELDPEWDPASDRRLTVWEATHHLIRKLDEGEASAAALLRRLPADVREAARDLAYRLYSICDRKGWAEPARDYNALATAWQRLTAEGGRPEQPSLRV